MLVNGRIEPTIPVTKGGWALFRLLNSSDARHFVIRLEEHELFVVGLDGGFLPRPYAADSILLGVGERYLVLVELTGEPGRTYAFTHEKYEHEDPFESDALPPGPIRVATLAYGKGEVAPTERPIFPAEGGPDLGPGEVVTHTWTLAERFAGGTFVNTIDGEVWPNIPVQRYAASGDYTFVIRNQGDPHPFHMHGNSFQVVAVDGKEVDLRAWKDTVTVAPGSSVRIRSRLENPGHWMYHCHILPHHEAGMMAELIVE
ncbi:multicopper oxidase family protein [Sorangium sp. So ce1128]